MNIVQRMGWIKAYFLNGNVYLSLLINSRKYQSLKKIINLIISEIGSAYFKTRRVLV